MNSDKTVFVMTYTWPGTTYPAINAIAVFTNSDARSLTVTINSPGAVSSRARWNLDGGTTWYPSGAVVPNLSAGPHTVAFSNVQGWTTPPSQTVTIAEGQTASATCTYTPVFAAIFSASTTRAKHP